MNRPTPLVLKRRQLLRCGLIGLGTVLSGGCGGGADVQSSAAMVPSIIAIVRKQLAYLTVSEMDLEAFARDYIRENEVPPKIRTMGSLFAGLYRYTPLFSMPLPALDGLREFEGAVAEQFLLSSDLFWNEPRKTEVRYLGYFSPHGRVCGNPFARFQKADAAPASGD